ncbi:unnamed protein product [Diamesa serratosioi]
MSEKKKLKQSRLSFQVLSSVSGTEVAKKPIETLPVIPDVSSSRKRRPSVEAESNRLTKVVKVLDSKEEKIVLIIEDSNDESEVLEKPKKVVDDVVNDVSVTSIVDLDVATKKKTTEKNVLQIKLPSKRKNADHAKSVNSTEEMHDDDSVVYLDVEEIIKTNKKSKKSSKKGLEKKKVVTKVVLEEVKLQEKNEIPESKELECKIVKDTSIVTSINNNESPSKSEDEENVDENCSDEVKDIVNLDSDSTGETKLKLSDSINDKSFSTILDDEATKKPLTPKQIKRREFFEEKRLEKERQRQKEREEKEEARKKERDVREDAKKQEREEKETQRRVERDEKEKKRLAELDLKNEEKRAKEEERKKRQDQIDEERKKKDETQKKKDLEKEEIENRKKRAAQQFTKFFVAKSKTKSAIALAATEDEMSIDSTEDAEQSGVKISKFKPFQLKVAMTLAPHVRRQITKKQLTTLDEALKVSKQKSELYLKKLKSKSYTPFRSEKVDESDDIQCIDDQESEGDNIMMTDKCDKNKDKYRAKFLSFTENRRPAFYGTWSKRSANITARKPLGQDECFDYEVDSDDEWEEEEPGESLHGSDDEKDKDSEGEDYDVDNDFLVPHGHLSDEELQQDEDIEEDNSPEAQKAKLKILQQEFAAEMKKKTEKIKPRLIGCIWMQGDEDENGTMVKGNGDKSYHCSSIIWRILKAREMICADEEIVLMEKIEAKILPLIVEAENVEKTPGPPKRLLMTDESVKDLITLVHGNTNSRKFLIREFLAFRLKNYFNDPDYLEFTIRSVQEKMSEICSYQSCPVDGVMFGKKCWFVKPEVQKKYLGDNELINLPNEWNYILEIKKKIIESVKKTELSPATSTTATPPPPASINKKIIITPKVQKLTEPKKVNLLSQYLKATQKTP